MNSEKDLFIYVLLGSLMFIFVSTDYFPSDVNSAMRERGLSSDSESLTTCEGFAEALSLEFEQLRRQALSDVHYTLQRLRSEAASLHSNNTCGALLQELQEQLRITAIDLSRLGEADELSKWREREAAELSALVQHRLRVLQHPAHCDSAKKVYCDFTTKTGRGIASQLHHLTYCFLAAYGTQRTLILNTTGFYGNPRGLDTFFLPLSDTCTTVDKSQMVPWPGQSNSRVLQFPGHDSPKPRPKYFPRSIPQDISTRLRRLHGDPFAWWMGQLFKYALRMNKDFQKYVQLLSKDIGFGAPIVGMHVRRSDKLKREAVLLRVEDYMKGVRDFYENLELQEPVAERRIFLATDDISVVAELREKFPEFVFVYHEASINSTSRKVRAKGPNFRFLMADIYFLSRSNYLVCGMTSNICRLAYEIMQTLHADASTLAWSVDTEYGFHFESPRYAQVRYSHSNSTAVSKGRQSELELKAGDMIQKDTKYFSQHRNAKDGFLCGRNMRTFKHGLYPAYKTVDVLDVADDLPSFRNIDKMPIND